MRDIKPKSEEEWYQILKDKRQKLRELVLNKDGNLVSRNTLIKRLDNLGIDVQEDGGTVHYMDKNIEERQTNSDDEYVESMAAKWPVGRADRLVQNNKHPDNLKSVEKKAKNMREFDLMLTPEFNRQAKEGDFPLEYTIEE
jgi:hypothetical protein